MTDQCHRHELLSHFVRLGLQRHFTFFLGHYFFFLFFSFFFPLLFALVFNWLSTFCCLLLVIKTLHWVGLCLLARVAHTPERPFSTRFVAQLPQSWTLRIFILTVPALCVVFFRCAFFPCRFYPFSASEHFWRYCAFINDSESRLMTQATKDKCYKEITRTYCSIQFYYDVHVMRIFTVTGIWHFCTNNRTIEDVFRDNI